MAVNNQAKRAEAAREYSALEQELAELMQDQRSETAEILLLLERLSHQERQSGYYVTSYPACNSEA